MSPRLAWITFLISIIVAVVLSIPSWLPVFGIPYESFGARLVAFIVGFLPVFMMAAGFIIGWVARNSKAKKELETIRDALGMTIEEAAEKLDLQAAEARMARERATREIRKKVRETEELYAALLNLSMESKRILYDAWVGNGLWDGDVKRHPEVLLLVDRGFMKELPTEDGGARFWTVSKDLMNLMNGDQELLEDFHDALLEAEDLENDRLLTPEQEEEYIKEFEALSFEKKIEVFKLLMWEDVPGSREELGWMDDVSFIDLEEVMPGTYAAECKPGVHELFKERDEVTSCGVPMCGVLMRVRDYLDDYRPINPDPEPFSV